MALKKFKQFNENNAMDFLKPKPKKELHKYYVYYFYFIDLAIKKLNDFGYDTTRENIFTDPIYYTFLKNMLDEFKPNGNIYRDSIRQRLIDELTQKIIRYDNLD